MPMSMACFEFEGTGNETNFKYLLTLSLWPFCLLLLGYCGLSSIGHEKHLRCGCFQKQGLLWHMVMKDMITFISRFYKAMRVTPEWKKRIIIRGYAIKCFNWSEMISHKYSQLPKCPVLSGQADSLDFLAGQPRDRDILSKYD